MIVLDTDTLSLYFAGHARVTQMVRSSEEVPVTSIVSRIEIVQGRFESVIKAADPDQLLRAQDRLAVAELCLEKFTVLSFYVKAWAEFGRLKDNKKVKAIGRNDLLIACIVLAHRAVLVTRNLRHFRKVPGIRLENWAD